MTPANEAERVAGIRSGKLVARECPYNHEVGTRCPNCARYPYPKGGSADYNAKFLSKEADDGE